MPPARPGSSPLARTWYDLDRAGVPGPCGGGQGPAPGGQAGVGRLSHAGRIGSQLNEVPRAAIEQTRDVARWAVGAEAVDRAWAEGQRFSWAEAIAAAQGQPSRRTPPGGLTARERQVAELVAEGLANRAVASRLHLSERIVENHVLHACTKLGLANRTQLAAGCRKQSRPEDQLSTFRKRRGRPPRHGVLMGSSAAVPVIAPWIHAGQLISSRAPRRPPGNRYRCSSMPRTGAHRVGPGPA